MVDIESLTQAQRARCGEYPSRWTSSGCLPNQQTDLRLRRPSPGSTHWPAWILRYGSCGPIRPRPSGVMRKVLD